MPEILSPQSAPNPDLPPPEAARESLAAEPTVNTQSADSMLGKKKKAGKQQLNTKAVVAIGVFGLLLMLVLVKTAPNLNKRSAARHAGAQQGKPKPSPDANANGLPTQSANTQNAVSTQGGNGVTPSGIQSLATNANASGAGDTSSGASDSTPGESHASLRGVPTFNPPPTPSEGGQWTPPAYSGSGAGAARPVDDQEIEREREKALTSKSLIFVAQPPPAQNTSAAASQITTTTSISNFGYATGTYLATHLEDVASTAVNAPVIADVDYDYQRNGVVIIPAGSRLIGTMGASNETGIVNLRFNRIRFPDGRAFPVSAIGLNHDLMPLKGYVTGKHRLEQLMLALGGGTASLTSVFAGGNLNGGISEADLLRMEAASQVGSFTSQQLSQMQDKVSRTLVVTVPAGTPVEAVFVAPRPQNGQVKQGAQP